MEREKRVDGLNIPAGFDISDLISLLLSESEEPVVILQVISKKKHAYLIVIIG